MNIRAERPPKQSKPASAKKSDLRSTTAVLQYHPDDRDAADGDSAEQQTNKSFTPAPKPAPLPAASPLISPHHRRRDRGSGDDDAAARLPIFVRFHDLRTAGIVSNWPQLYNLIDDYGFPTGVMLSPNVRAWKVEDVRAWLDGRPMERKAIAPHRAKQTEDA